MTTLSVSRRSILAGAAFAGSMLAAPAVRAQAKPLVVGNSAGAVTLTLQEVIKQKRFLEEFDVRAEFQNIADGSKIVGGIIGGNIDVSMTSGISQIFPAAERGGGLMKVLGGAWVLTSYGVFTGKADIRKLSDLEGRTVGVGSLGAQLHALMVALLRKHKVDVSKVKFANIGSSVDVVRAVSAGIVDAGPGDLSTLDGPLGAKVSLLEQGNFATELPEYTLQASWSSDAKVQANRDQMVRLFAAHAKLYRYLQQDPAAKEVFIAARKVVLPNATPEDNESQWNQIANYKPFATDLLVSEDRIRYMQQLNVDLGVQSKILPYEQVADMSIAKAAVALLK